MKAHFLILIEQLFAPLVSCAGPWERWLRSLFQRFAVTDRSSLSQVKVLLFLLPAFRWVCRCSPSLVGLSTTPLPGVQTPADLYPYSIPPASPVVAWLGSAHLLFIY